MHRYLPALGAEYYFFLYVGELKLYSGALLFVSRIKKARTVIGALSYPCYVLARTFFCKLRRF